MMGSTHTILSVAATSLTLATADPIVLTLCAVSSQLPDIDTSKSLAGRALFPISRYLENRFPHRSITHSFMALAIFAAVSFPVAIANRHYWLGLVSGYFWGFFGDVFTKSGVALFYPSQAKAICPGNPRLRLSTGSGAEYFLVGLLTIVAIASVNMNSSGGILKAFNSAVGIPEGAVEIINSDGAYHLMFVFIKGRNAITQEPVSGEFEVVRPLTATDLLVKNSQGLLYRAGTTQNCQITATQVQTRRGSPITATIKEIRMDSEDLEDTLAQAPRGARVYISGMLRLEDAEELNLLSNPQQFATISLQPAAGASIAHIESASLEEIIEKLGEYYATGTLIVRSINVQS